MELKLSLCAIPVQIVVTDKTITAGTRTKTLKRQPSRAPMIKTVTARIMAKYAATQPESAVGRAMMQFRTAALIICYSSNYPPLQVTA